MLPQHSFSSAKSLKQLKRKVANKQTAQEDTQPKDTQPKKLKIGEIEAPVEEEEIVPEEEDDSTALLARLEEQCIEVCTAVRC